MVQTGIATWVAAGTAPTLTGACQGIDSLVPSSSSFSFKHQTDSENISVYGRYRSSLDQIPVRRSKRMQEKKQPPAPLPARQMDRLGPQSS